MVQNRTALPRKGAASRIARLIAPSPRWNSASFRPARRAKRPGPTTPREMAASVGPMVTPASAPTSPAMDTDQNRSEEHTSELQSRQYLVCRLLLEKQH